MPSLTNRSSRLMIALAVCAGLSLAPTPGQSEVVTAAFPAVRPVKRPIIVTVPIVVALTADFVIMLRVPEEIGTIVMGNASIADATLSDGRMIILKGVAPGVSNMIVLDTEDRKLAEFVVKVHDRKPGTVTVRRAMVVQSYTCLDGLCENTGSALPPGDVSLLGPN